MNNLEEILPQKKIIAIIRTSNLAEGQNQIMALQQVGFSIIEISLNSPNAFALFEWARHKYTKLCLGAASILNLQQAQAAQQKGFDFFVSPIMNKALMRFALDQGLNFIPGACTPTEISQVLQFYDFSLIKLFPTNCLQNYLGLKKVFPEASFLLSSFPIQEIKNFAKAGANYFAIGSFLTENINSIKEKTIFLNSQLELNLIEMNCIK